jgi:hypothetical protein
MHRVPLLALLAALAAGCSSSSDPAPRFDGTTGTAWETLQVGASGCPGFSDYTPAGQTGFYQVEQATAARYTPADGWTALEAPPADLGCWPSPAWVGTSLYVMRGGAIHAFDTVGGAWSTPVASGVAATSDAQMAHDDAGHVYAVESASPFRVIRYTPATGVVDYLETGGFDGLSVYEPRLAWDSIARKLYVGPAYDLPNLFAFDPAAPGSTTALASVPDASGATGTGLGDPFCGDRSGHLYAIGDSGCSGSATVFQYDIAAGTWRRLVDLPEDHGCNGACTVSDDGWLYLATGNSPNLYRLKLN